VPIWCCAYESKFGEQYRGRLVALSISGAAHTNQSRDFEKMVLPPNLFFLLTLFLIIFVKEYLQCRGHKP
jgi:hypothetical protein